MNNLDTIISNDAWDALSLAEKAEMMRVAVNNGITDLQEIREQYNEFAERGSKEGKKVNTNTYSVGNLVDALYQNNPREEYLGEPSHHYDFTQSDEWANAHGYYPDARGHRDDRVKKPAHPSHPSKGIWSKDGRIFNLTDVGIKDPNYIIFGLADGGQDPQATLMYKGTTVLPELTVTPKDNYYMNSYDNYKLSYAKGGNLFDTSGSKDDDLVNWIIKEEGFSAKPENIGDGKITLGSGLTNPKWHQLYKKRGNKWSASDNRRAVKEEVANRRRWAEKNIPNWNYLPDSSQKALLSYKYNYDFNKTNSPKLFQALADHNYTEAARQMNATSKDSKFKKGLQARRKREQKWFLNDFMETTPTASSTTSSTPTVPSFDVAFTEPAASTNVFNPYIQQVTNTQYVPLREPASDSYIETVEVTPEEQRRRKLQQVMEAHTRFNNIMKLIRPRREKIPQFIPDNFLDIYNIGYSRGGKIHIKPENRGKFTALKERTGHSATWFKQHGTPAQKKMAVFALNSRHWKHGLGGNLFR